MRRWALYMAGLVCAMVSAQTPLEKFLQSPAIRFANVGVSVRKLSTGEQLVSYRSGNLIPPASVIKLFSTATALERWGAEYHFKTELRYAGTIRDGVLYGDLYIVGYGDPTLGGREWGEDAFFAKWIQAVRESGIQRIEGRVVANTSYYDGSAVNPGWVYEDIGNYYAPGIFALAYLDNTMNVQLKSGPIGSVATVLKIFPSIPGIEFENHIRCTEIDYDGAYVHGLPYQNCRYLTGGIPSNLGVFGVKSDIPNPPLLLADHFTRRLRVSGIAVRDSAGYITESDWVTTQLLYTHYSPSLASIVEQTNLHSINLNAEMIFRNLASGIKVPCTIHNASDYIKSFWINRGVDVFTAQILDGCGLAPQDGLSTDHLVNLLTYMSHSSNYDAFFRSLPVAGQSGTMKNILANTELCGKVHAKSGTIKGTRNYAGYIDLPNGDELVFAVMVNCSHGSSTQIKRAIEQYLLDVYRTNK